MEEVALCVHANPSVDRLYFCDQRLPLYVSHGPELSQQAFRMSLFGRDMRI